MDYSVLMTVYKKDNSEYFSKSIMSMVEQTKIPDEIVIVKDGPITEELQTVIDKIDGKYPNLIRQVSLPKNVGLGLALNEGIKHCKNELLARMDSDDISLPIRCEKQVAEFEKNPKLDIVGCPVIEFVGKPDNKVGRRCVPLDNSSIYKYAKKRDPFNHPTVMFRKSAVERVGGYGDLRKNQDTDLWIKMLSNGAVCKNLREPLLKFRFDESTYKKRKNWLNTKLLIEIRWKAFRTGFCSIFDFLEVSIMQIAIFLLPIGFQKIIYKRFLRSNE